MRFLVLTLIFVAWAAGQTASKADYLGGTVTEIRAGAGGRIRVDNQEHLIFSTRRTSIGVPYKRINLLEYGQHVSRRLVLAYVLGPWVLPSKKFKHFLTLGFEADDGHQQAMVFRVNKGDIRVVLASLEARTGVKVVYLDEQPR
ncbi:MAG: hypothetical protein R2729_25670 [Bryobacteraceae bacterium]